MRFEPVNCSERTLASLATCALVRLQSASQWSRSKARRLKAQAGFTFIEMALVIAVLGILSAFAIVSFGNGQENRDAATIQAAQGSLQSIVSQGSIRMDQRPDQLDSNAVLTAFRTALGQDSDTQSGSVSASVSGGSYTVSISKGSNSRSATFVVTSSGDVQLTGLNNFTAYKIDKTKTPWTIIKGP